MKITKRTLNNWTVTSTNTRLLILNLGTAQASSLTWSQAVKFHKIYCNLGTGNVLLLEWSSTNILVLQPTNVLQMFYGSMLETIRSATRLQQCVHLKHFRTFIQARLIGWTDLQTFQNWLPMRGGWWIDLQPVRRISGAMLRKKQQKHCLQLGISEAYQPCYAASN